jgi:hypothetical protein
MAPKPAAKPAATPGKKPAAAPAKKDTPAKGKDDAPVANAPAAANPSGLAPPKNKEEVLAQVNLDGLPHCPNEQIIEILKERYETLVSVFIHYSKQSECKTIEQATRLRLGTRRRRRFATAQRHAALRRPPLQRDATRQQRGVLRAGRRMLRCAARLGARSDGGGASSRPRRDSPWLLRRRSARPRHPCT